MHIATIGIVFGVIFVAELPDKSMFASLALSTRFRHLYVWLGAAAAFLCHVIIAVTAGHFLTLLPKHLLELVVGVLFTVGAGLLLFGKNEDEASQRAPTNPASPEAKQPSGAFWKVFGTSFLVIFLGEWGDITQIATANYTAKYHDPWSVGVGATLGLWAVAALGIALGAKLLNRVPARTLQRVTGLILLGFAVFSIVSAFRG
ncbi:MAG TPA: TMEM165/GDT1 family protein [Candidatus Saccharimonadales bacterium]|nr:TMEM165/GDT1 family protein [Candidatus Saccharimonadales bacterium]